MSNRITTKEVIAAFSIFEATIYLVVATFAKNVDCTKWSSKNLEDWLFPATLLFLYFLFVGMSTYKNK